MNAGPAYRSADTRRRPGVDPASTRRRPGVDPAAALLHRLFRASNLLSSELYTWLAKVLKRGFIGIVAVDHIDEFAPEIRGTR